MNAKDIDASLDKKPQHTALDEHFTATTIARISRIENAKAAKKGFFNMARIKLLRPLHGLSTGAIVALVCTAGASAAAAGYLWQRTTVEQIGSRGNITTYQTTGCPDFYRLQNNPTALQKASLNKLTKVELRPDVKNLPADDQQKIVQAYCEINQLQAYASETWKSTSSAVTYVDQPFTVTTISSSQLEGTYPYFDADHPSNDIDQKVSVKINAGTVWMGNGERIQQKDIHIGDVVVTVTQDSHNAHKNLAVIKLPLANKFYSMRYQGMLLPLRDCVGTPNEQCVDTQMTNSLFFSSSATAPRVQAENKEVQAKIVGIQGDTYHLLSRGGKPFDLQLANLEVANNQSLQVGDWLHVKYTGDIAKARVFAADLLMYSQNGKFGPYVKYQQ